jgi:RecA/RadA recombinase
MAKKEVAAGNSSSIMSKMLAKAGKFASVLSSSPFAEKKVLCSTNVPMINVMMSGELDGGLKAGLTQVVGESRTFKSVFCLVQVKAYLDEYPDAICIFLDNEFGAAQYFATVGIDPDRVAHCPVTDVESLKNIVMTQLEEIEPGQHVIFFLDSLSQLASLKETEDAIEGKVVADMTRAKMINSFFRMVTPRFVMKDIPFLFINSFYEDTTNKYADKILKSGKQAFLSSDTILFVTRSQVKEKGEELRGWSFNYRIMKSRVIKEQSKFEIEVLYKGGISINSGLFEAALESGFIVAPKQGWYETKVPGRVSTKLLRKKEIEDDQEFFDVLIKNKDFIKYVHGLYALEGSALFDDTKLELVDPETGEVVVLTAGDED